MRRTSRKLWRSPPHSWKESTCLLMKSLFVGSFHLTDLSPLHRFPTIHPSKQGLMPRLWQRPWRGIAVKHSLLFLMLVGNYTWYIGHSHYFLAGCTNLKIPMFYLNTFLKVWGLPIPHLPCDFCVDQRDSWCGFFITQIYFSRCEVLTWIRGESEVTEKQGSYHKHNSSLKSRCISILRGYPYLSSPISVKLKCSITY